MADYGVMPSEPRYKVDALVQEIAGRRDAAIQDMADQLKSLVLGLVDQFAMLKKHRSSIDLGKVEFHNIRWTREGNLVMDVYHNHRRLRPDSDIRYW